MRKRNERSYARFSRLRLLDVGGTTIPTAGKLEIKTMSIGGKLPESLPNNFGLESADVENVLDIRIMPAPVDKTAGDVMLDHSPIIKTSWGLPATSEWTPAVKEMMRKAFLKTEG